MALKIRLQRHGSTHDPKYRVVVAESSARRDGKFVETLGMYNPSPKGKDIPFSINLERADYWLSVGAQPTDTAKALIKKARAAVQA
ncbi:MAG: 30S ribosomal protein S16 [Verrucomicrobiaceae bacterium]|jgi:small subunit ribosomal protein S16|nr:30S ribosomal protein S16 [Verrucomicrobiaceae bacterium]